jgi:hypothetical protein
MITKSFYLLNHGKSVAVTRRHNAFLSSVHSIKMTIWVIFLNKGKLCSITGLIIAELIRELVLMAKHLASTG